MRKIVQGSVVLLLAACAGRGSLEGGVYRDADASYRLAEPPRGWRPVSFADTDLAWAHGGSGHVIAVNAVCEEHGDPSLKVLTDHLLLGFEDRELVEREPLRLAGRGALRSRVRASLDGVPVELELTLLKKDGCVYDLLYTAPRGAFDALLADYRAIVSSFEPEGAR